MTKAQLKELGPRIEQVRRFNRTVTQRVGALNDRFLGRQRPLSEARLLFEIGPNGIEIRDLRSRLHLDSGYTSRLLRSLEKQVLIKSVRSEEDSRAVFVRLTAKGLRELDELDRRARDFAESILSGLNAQQQDRLVTAMEEVEKLLRAAVVEVHAEPPDSRDARFCLQQYFSELAERFDSGFDPKKSISAEPEELVPPLGVFVIARLDNYAIGCGGLKVKAGRIGEIKRMWVSTDCRGLGIGRKVLHCLEEHARAFGLKKLRLETNRSLKEAQILYRTSGYAEVNAFSNEPYAHHWFEKAL